MALQESVTIRNCKLDAEVYGSINGAGSTILPWVISTAYTIRTSWVTLGGNVYLCTTSGTSAGSGGPSGTGSDITDGTAHWTYIGPAGVEAAPTLSLYNGTIPANCAASLSGNTLLATGTLPAGWLAAASSGAKAKAGTWTVTGQSGASTGTVATFFRILDAAGVCHYQGTVGIGTGDMQFDNTNIANTQVVTVTSFTLTAGNA